MRAAVQEIRDTITLRSPWFSSLPLTTCTGVSDDVDFKYTRCLGDGPELNPHHPQGETGTVLSLASDPEPTSRLCLAPQHSPARYPSVDNLSASG